MKAYWVYMWNMLTTSQKSWSALSTSAKIVKKKKKLKRKVCIQSKVIFI